MAATHFKEPIEPMTLGNMRANGVRSLAVHCWQCHHQVVINADQWSDDVPVPTFGPRMVCTRCGVVGADARPDCQEQPPRESLTGVQWRSTKGRLRGQGLRGLSDRHKLGSHVDLPRWSVSPSQRRDRPCVGSSPTLPRGWGLRSLLAELL
jgi:hypothetical protein